MPGDVTGIGPEISAKLIASGATEDQARVVVIGDKRVFDIGMRDAAIEIPHTVYHDIGDITWPRNDLSLLDLANIDPAQFPQGVSSNESGKLSGDTLKFMIDLALAGKIDGICFAPLNKGAMNKGG